MIHNQAPRRIAVIQLEGTPGLIAFRPPPAAVTDRSQPAAGQSHPACESASYAAWIAAASALLTLLALIERFTRKS